MDQLQQYGHMLDQYVGSSIRSSGLANSKMKGGKLRRPASAAVIGCQHLSGRQVGLVNNLMEQQSSPEHEEAKEGPEQFSTIQAGRSAANLAVTMPEEQSPTQELPQVPLGALEKNTPLLEPLKVAPKPVAAPD
jgi:hypothetical protein